MAGTANENESLFMSLPYPLNDYEFQTALIIVIVISTYISLLRRYCPRAFILWFAFLGGMVGSLVTLWIRK